MACLMQYIRCFRLYVSAKTVQRCRFRTMCYALPIRTIHHSAAPALGNTTDHTSRIRVLSNSIKRRKPAGEGYVLRTTYPYYISSAESPRERAIYYALHIRIIYQALKAHPRELSVPHALHTRIMYQAPKARPRELCTTHYVSVLCIKRRKPAEEGYGVRITYLYYVSSAEP